MEKGKWMCPACKWTIEVVSDDRATISNSLRKENRSRSFPAHSNCELRKKFTEIDFTTLVKLA